jgi:tRNA U34 5-carboxymethylaminomethyl modifying GTPase MnmE/TrmE
MAGIDALAAVSDGGDADDATMAGIERRMQELAQQAAARADVVVMVHDATDPGEPIKLGRAADVIVRTKIDLLATGIFPPSPSTQGEGGGEGVCMTARSQNATPTLTLPLSAGRGDKKVAARGGAVDVSALTGVGMDLLRDRLDRAAFGEGGSGGGASALTLNARHRLAIESAGAALERAIERVDADESEWVAAELRVALDELGSVTGVVSPDDILGRIFSTFCIGK